MIKKPTFTKLDQLREMREARYAEAQKRNVPAEKKRRTVARAPTRATKTKRRA